MPALANGIVTFGGFNRLSKLRPPVIALWARRLRALPDSRFLLGGMPPDGQHTFLVDWLPREGIARERLTFNPMYETPAYLALHRQVDNCRYAVPYTGVTTTAHTLRMGVPTRSLAGRTPPGRHGATILGYVGLDALLARDAEEFESKGLGPQSRSAGAGPLNVARAMRRIGRAASGPHHRRARERTGYHVSTPMRRLAPRRRLQSARTARPQTAEHEAAARTGDPGSC